MGVNSNFNEDIKAERALAKFLDKFFYEKMTSNGKSNATFKRVDDAEEQHKGIDLYIDVPSGKRIFIDEKASLRYSNSNLSTFAFEINSLKRGRNDKYDNPEDLAIGWLLNDSLKTDVYVLCWPNIRNRKKDGRFVAMQIGDLTIGDFTIVEIYIIYKNKIINYLDSIGYSKDRLLEIADDFRNEKMNSTRKFEVNRKVNIQYSIDYAEKPINIIINKDILLNLANSAYFVSNRYVSKIK